MRSCDEQRYSTYILELVRNNGITNMDGENSTGAGEDEEVPFSFFMFDYFDVLYCKELCGDQKKYLNYLSIENVFEDTIQHSKNYKVSYKTLSLYRKSDCRKSNIFSIEDTGQYLSDIPFLGLIQISLCKDNYIGKKIEEISIEGFLESCENRIIKIAEHYISSGTAMQLFRSSTTGDFCLALRTGSIKEIYDVAIALNGTQNEPKETVKMLTFTNVGIECRYVQGIGYATLDKEFVKSHPEAVIALRFCADESLREEIQTYLEEGNKGEVETLNGLFGRYEYLLHIGLDEFLDIYPALCEQKFGKFSMGSGKSELADIFRKPCIQNVNERILVRLEPGTPEKLGGLTGFCDKQDYTIESSDQEDRREVFKKNEQLLDRIKDLEKKKDIFQEEHFAFQDLVRGMKEIYKAFSPAGMDKESYINWRIFHKDMNILCKCIEQMLKTYEKIENSETKDEKKVYRNGVLGDWRNNLHAISRYTTLVQNVNYQTYQAPIYEIQTQIDTEKAMVAYREAMALYITEGIWKSPDKGDKEWVFPIIYPDLSKDTVEVAAPFRTKNHDMTMTAREIICTVPSFEYFGRLYDLLPWIIHETSHHFNITGRKERNEFLVKYILSWVFKVILRKSLRKLSNTYLYESAGIVENYLVTSMSVVAQKEIFKKDDLKEFSYEKLISEIDNWIGEMFPLGAGYEGDTYINNEEQLKKQMFNFWLDSYRKEKILFDDNLDLILHVLDEDKLEEREKLAKTLLDEYYKNVCKVLKDEKKSSINLHDMYDYERLEKKLRSYAKVSDSNKAAAREYIYQVLEIYRIMKINAGISANKYDGKKLKQFINKVFIHYRKNYMEKAKNDVLADTVVMHITRRLGLMNDNLGMFQKEMGEILQNVDNVWIMKHKDTRKRSYLETYADVLMATSLQLTGFGYCRQLLQTVSDARLADMEYGFEHPNYERWRTVAAVLLVKEGAEGIDIGNGKKKVPAKTLIKEGKMYCEYTFRCILEKLLKMGEIRDDKRVQEKLKRFLWIMYFQIENYIGKRVPELKRILLLHVLLYGDKSNCDDRLKKVWDEYEEVAKYCDGIKYNFWRIDCFCRGIGNIVQDGHITVSGDLFDHMNKVRIAAEGKDTCKHGCCWEKDYDFLTGPKRDVGAFYNDPRQVHEKTPDQKLENTIDFIQNYYYYNRFRIMNEPADFSAGLGE